MEDVIEKLKDDEEYYRGVGKNYLSNSDIGTLLSNPKEYGVSRPDNINFAKGRYFHQLILEPEKAKETKFVDCSTRNTKIYKEHLVESEQEFVMLEKEGEELRELVKTLLGNIDMFELIRDPENEYEVPAIKEIKGMMWKGKADIVHPEMLIDIKTTSKIDDFKWSARKYNYDSQCYIYQQLFGKPLVFIAVDKVSGMIGIFRPTEDFIRRGEVKVERAIEVYKNFFDKNSENNIENYYIDEMI
jgi:hypothetical protein